MKFAPMDKNIAVHGIGAERRKHCVEFLHLLLRLQQMSELLVAGCVVRNLSWWNFFSYLGWCVSPGQELSFLECTTPPAPIVEMDLEETNFVRIRTNAAVRGHVVERVRPIVKWVPICLQLERAETGDRASGLCNTAGECCRQWTLQNP